MQSDRTLRKWYVFINRKFFDGELPANVCVRWANLDEEKEARWEEQYCGWMGRPKDGKHEWEVVLSKKKDVSPSVRLSTLAHEMCHVATKERDDHGPAFDRWHKRLTERGLFKKGAVHKNLTLF